MKPLWYFFIFSIFLLLFWNFQLRFGLERNGTVNFIFSLSRHFPIYFGLKWYQNGIVEFFCYFFGIFYDSPGRNGTERNDNFYFPSFPAFFQPILSWKESIMVFFNFLNFFAIFLEFSITRRVGTKRNDNFYFFSFSAFSNLFWLGMKP